MTTGPVQATIHIEKGSIGFAAAHFNCIGGDRELLHGHNYTVGLRARGDVGADGAIVDFAVLKDALRSICDGLDHHMLVPTQSEDIAVAEQPDGYVGLTYRDGKRFLFPIGDCVLLAMPNSTCECLAAHILERLRGLLGEAPVRLEVSVDESPGQGAVVTEDR